MQRSSTRRATGAVGLLVACLLVASACGDSTGENGATRSFTLGFTDFPHASSVQAVAAAWQVIARDGDMATMHFDDGVPWQEALAGAPYDSAWQAELDWKAGSIPAGHVTYLAITPLAFSRDRLADHRGAAGNEPLTPPWDTFSFDAPEVIAAYAAHCERMLAIFTPDYFAYAIEANMLFSLDPVEWPAFVSLAQAVYTTLKASHPDLPIFLTLQADYFHLDSVAQAQAISQVISYTDLIAVSTYPYAVNPDPGALPAEHFRALALLAPSKPFAVAETAWPAQDVTSPYPVFIPSDETNQLLYVQHLLAEADVLEAAFVNWFFTRDYDEFWESQLQFLPSAPLIRLWKDTGLYDGQGRARPALTPWREALARSRPNLP